MITAHEARQLTENPNFETLQSLVEVAIPKLEHEIRRLAKLGKVGFEVQVLADEVHIGDLTRELKYYLKTQGFKVDSEISQKGYFLKISWAPGNFERLTE